MTTIKTAALALSLCAAAALSLPAHSEAASARLSPQAVRSFLRVIPAVRTCSGDLPTVMDDLSQVSQTFASGSPDTGSLGDDAQQLRADCLFAAGRVSALRFSAAQPVAQSCKAQLRAALLDSAEGGADLSSFVDDINSGDYGSALVDLRSSQSAFSAGTAHLRALNGSLRF